ncbi:MAG TPA: hypothetical protein LFW20_04785 [Rickettsia endosymbiont of Omalisus fontisbellaquei]|nr:hypothetical protein [Rickettsia endosymbiont of Omalisus fontisbellaquei]
MKKQVSLSSNKSKLLALEYYKKGCALGKICRHEKEAIKAFVESVKSCPDSVKLYN